MADFANARLDSNKINAGCGLAERKETPDVAKALVVARVAEEVRLFGNALHYGCIVFAQLEIGVQRENVMHEDRKHVDDDCEEQLLSIGIDNIPVNELNEQPDPVLVVVRVFLQFIRVLKILILCFVIFEIINFFEAYQNEIEH